ncbi:MAG: hypothetical protein ACRD5H_18975 [Nitrososphaerales archaeon]
MGQVRKIITFFEERRVVFGLDLTIPWIDYELLFALHLSENLQYLQAADSSAGGGNFVITREV